MPSPFPGMDPYLEHPRFFPGLHSSLITFIKLDLQGRLPEAYYAESDQYVWLETSHHHVEPDVNVISEQRQRKPKRRRTSQGGVAVVEAEPGLEASLPVIIAVETVEHEEHVERFSRSSTCYARGRTSQPSRAPTPAPRPVRTTITSRSTASIGPRTISSIRSNWSSGCR